jgi:hypothetical protein
MKYIFTLSFLVDYYELPLVISHIFLNSSNEEYRKYDLLSIFTSAVKITSSSYRRRKKAALPFVLEEQPFIFIFFIPIWLLNPHPAW